jgi:hypothetical protein
VGDPTQQVHDWEPGIRDNGLFWTIPIDAGAVDVNPGTGEARFRGEAVRVRDFHDFFNAISPNPTSAPARVSYDVRWSGGGARSKIRDTTFGFVGQYVSGPARVSFTAMDDGGAVLYTSDSGGQYNLDGTPPAVGIERNGIFFH